MSYGENPTERRSVMFGRALSVQVVKAPKPGAEGTVVCTHPSAEEIETIIRNGVMDVARLIAVGYVGKKAVDTICKVAVISAKSKLL
jgi:hypothetical protein